jgi:uncharacterized membrane-anchored protein
VARAIAAGAGGDVSPLVVRVVTVIAAFVVLAGVNYSIRGKERIIEQGEVIYLELAPVDPRSLMQGDYMALRFALAEDISPARDATSVALTLDERRVATLDRSNKAPLRMRYRIRNEQVWLGTNAYFFEEGSAERYAAARYGEFRISGKTGEAVLVGLCDAALRRL